jgi:UDP-N-acetylmuramoyl-tripeptide--D-alanyl-D-alanine ligase
MKLQELHRLFLESNGVSTDTRTLKKGELFFALKGPAFNADDFALEALNQGAHYAIVSNAFSSDHPQLIHVDDPLITLQELARFHRKTFDIPVIALTGSNGKTTTKELINSVLRQKYQVLVTQGNLNNHIGVPLTLLGLNPDHEMAVIEMGANHQGEIAALANIADPTHGMITNFGKAHLEGFGGVEGVIKGKQELYNHLKAKDGTLFYNSQDSIQQKAIIDYSHKVAYGICDSNASTAECNLVVLSEAPYLRLSFQGQPFESVLFGSYNAVNCAAALCIGSYFGVPAADAIGGIMAYVPSNMRSEIIERGQQKILLDAYNANPSSMASALKVFDALDWQHKGVILGDMFELGSDSALEHQNIVNFVQSLGFKKVYLLGEHFTGTKNEYQTFNSTKDFISTLPEEVRTLNLLIKGSRGMALEQILEAL